jgi:rare lipoprotein A
MKLAKRALAAGSLTLLLPITAGNPVRPLEQTPPKLDWIASWYGPRFHGRRTANGEVFSRHAFTVAHRTLPFGTVLSLEHEGRWALACVNDRGPYAVWRGVRYYRGKRDVDVSERVARELGFVEKGLARVRVQVLFVPDAGGDCAQFR